MSKAKMLTVPKKRIELLMAALGISRVQFAAICEASSNSVGYWQEEGKMPAFRLKKIAKALEKKIRGCTDLSKEEIEAKEFLELILEQKLEVIAMNHFSNDPRSHFKDQDEGEEETPTYKPLSDYSENELAAAIDAKGWSVSLTWKGKTD